MRSAARESDLALYVEGDLPHRKLEAIETHLRNCSACRAFLAELRLSQDALHALAAEPTDQDALASLRARIATATRRPSSRPLVVRRLAIAASLAAAATASFWLALPALRGSRASRQALQAGSSPQPTPVPPQPPALPSPGPPPPASHHAGRVLPAPLAPRLSPEDADQLARAVLALSRIESVEQALRVPPEPDPSPTPLVRLATSDPDIVIYWQLDTNGGQ